MYVLHPRGCILWGLKRRIILKCRIALIFVYIFSFKCLAGHEGPVSDIAFSPVAASSAFVSVSWDKTLKIWNAIEGEKEYETVQLGSEGISNRLVLPL